MGRAWRQKGGWQGVEGGASPSAAHPLQRAVTTERRSQLPFCLAPSTVGLILALAFVARLAEIAADIGTALRALANAKSTATRPITVFQQSPWSDLQV